MKNEAIADIFEETAKLLEFGNENPFRIRAYQNASLNLRVLSEDLAEIRKRGELRGIQGIGPDLAGKIEEYLDTGKIEFYEKLKAKTPPFLVEMIRIPGLGPKTSKLIYARFKPQTLDELEKLVSGDKILNLPGVKEKTCQKIKEGIAFLRSHEGQAPLGQALTAARSICQKLSAMKGVKSVTVAGSVRRMCETVHDIDILVAAVPKAAAEIMEGFTKLYGVQKVLVKGPTKTSVILFPGIQTDLRVVEPDAFGAALVYFTGSKEHNVKLRIIAKKKGLKVNEYGVFKEKTGKKVAGRTEEEVYAALDLPFIPPELREDHGEIEAAREGRLPVLLERGDLKGDFHLHSDWSDGIHKIEEMAEAARKLGLTHAVLTDHSRSLTIANGLTPERLMRQIAVVKKLNERWKDFTLLIGSEVDILEDGTPDFENDVLKKLDFVVASVHSRFKQDKQTMTRRIIKAMQNPYVSVIGHPTGRRLSGRPPYELDFEAVFEAAIKTGTALEMNGSPDRMDLNYLHARRARELGVLLTVDSDAHKTEEFQNLEYGAGTARKAGCAKENVLNCLSLAELRKALKRPA